MAVPQKKPFKVPGPRGLDIVRVAVAAGRFEDNGQAERTAATNVNAHGYLDRDKKAASVWYPTDKAREMLAWLDAGVSGGEVVAASAEASTGLTALAVRNSQARLMFADGDVFAARQLAEGVYDQAKAGASFSARFKLKESLAACHRIQADALDIEVKAKMRIAEEWEKAGQEGKTLKGRPKSVPDENAFTAEEAGLTRKELHYAKKLLDADRREPGIAERAIAARLAAGLEPTRASLRASIGTKTATKEERGNNLYETGPEAMFTLLALEKFGSLVWDPSCGRGATSRPMEDAGYDVRISDLVDYGTATAHGELQEVADFLTTEAFEDRPDIVTNPPYGAVLNAFVAHALKVHRPRKMALLLNANFWFGYDDPERNFVLDENPPARKLSFSRRLPMMHRDGWTGPVASSSMNTAWFIWELQPDGTYGSQTVDIRVNWTDYVPVEMAAEADEVAA